MMTKKDFIRLADKVKALKGSMFHVDFEVMKIALADYCEEQNERFLRQRWYDYIDGKCGKNGGKVKANV